MLNENFIIRACKAYKLDRAQIAKFVGTHVQTVYKWETGERTPSAAVVTLFDALDVLMTTQKGRRFVADKLQAE